MGFVLVNKVDKGYIGVAQACGMGAISQKIGRAEGPKEP